jgi:hypothetical protein
MVGELIAVTAGPTIGIIGGNYLAGLMNLQVSGGFDAGDAVLIVLSALITLLLLAFLV